MAKEKTDKQEKSDKAEMYKKLNSICQIMQKQYGKESVTYLGNSEIVPQERFTTQCDVLDVAMGGGYPFKIIEIFGPESSGKSTVCLHAIASAQKKYPKEPVALIDVEYSFDPIYARNLGVKVDELLVSQPNDGDEALNALITFISLGIKLIIVDSVAALLPKEEAEAGIEQQTMGLQARLMSRALRKINQAVGTKEVTVIFTNQIREKIGQSYGDKTTTPGGNALKFYASIRMKLAKLGVVKEGEEKVSARIKATIVKNKTFPPFRECEFIIRFGEGIDALEATITLAIDQGIIEKKASWLSYGGETIAQGIADLRKWLEANPTKLDEIRVKIKEKGAPVTKLTEAEKEEITKENEEDITDEVEVSSV